MKIDENTGLPELPEGYFWRVEHPYYEGSWTYIQLGDGPRQKIGGVLDTSKVVIRLMSQGEEEMISDLRSKWVQKILPRKEEFTTPPPKVKYSQECKETSDQAILNAAYTILKRKREDERLASKLGDYPPKKLGG